MRRVTGMFAAIAALMVLSVGAPAAASAPADRAVIAEAGSTAGHGSSEVEANKAMVTFVYDQLFNHGNFSVIDTFIGPVYIQHNPGLVDGTQALRDLVTGLRTRFPNSVNTIVRVVGQGDLVMIYHHSVAVPGTAGTAIMDVFRVREGKIVEHWDVIQPVPANTANGNDMFATLSPSGDRSTLRSELIVLSYYVGLTQKHDLRAVDRFVSPSLIQHDPALANGSAAVKAAFSARLQANPQLMFSSLQVVADHDLVSLRYHVQDSPTDLGQAVNDIYRVNDGKIVEHWSVTQNVPATSANNNTMF